MTQGLTLDRYNEAVGYKTVFDSAQGCSEMFAEKFEDLTGVLDDMGFSYKRDGYIGLGMMHEIYRKEILSS